VAHTLFVTKQKVLELTGHLQGTLDPDLQIKIDKLNNINSQYERLETLAKQLLNNFKSYTESIKLFGDHFYEAGVKEDSSSLGEPLRECGNLHRLLDKQSAEFVDSVNSLVDVVSTFKSAAIEDTMINLQRYTLARQEFDGALLNLANARAGSTPTSAERVAQCELLVEENKKLMDQLGHDLHTKVIMLNEKRVQDISVRLSEYVYSLKEYYRKCNTLMEQYHIEIRDDSTPEFKALMGEM